MAAGVGGMNEMNEKRVHPEALETDKPPFIG